jgi:hypothetical protein
MELLFILIGLGILYVIIQAAIDYSINTKIQKENYKILVEIREILKNKS